MTRREGRTALYRLYDGDGRLLYVGIASSFGRRWEDHASLQPWWPEVRRQVIDWYPRADAEAAEVEAIESEGPLHNVVHAIPRVEVKRVDRWDAAENRALGLEPVATEFWFVDCPFCAEEHRHDPQPGPCVPPCKPSAGRRGSRRYIILAPVEARRAS